SKFAEFHSARQVHMWFRDEDIELPVKAHNPEADGVVWRLPAYNTVHNILTNPIYAGAYAFGRTTSKVSIADGHKHVRRGVRRPLSECDVVIKDHHEGYISWEEFERNQQVIADLARPGPSRVCTASANTGTLQRSATASGPSVARSRSRPPPRSSASAI